MATRPPKLGLAKAIVEARKAKGLNTQMDLAEEADVSIATVKNLERGQAGDTKHGTLRKIAKACGLTLPELLRRAGMQPERPELEAGLARFRKSWWNLQHLVKNHGGAATDDEVDEIYDDPPRWLVGDGINDESIARCVESIRAARNRPMSAHPGS